MKYWTVAEREIVRQRVVAGALSTDIAREFGVSQRAIQGVVYSALKISWGFSPAAAARRNPKRFYWAKMRSLRRG